MRCKFCYATYNSFKVGQQLPFEDVALILDKLYKAGVKKVTFAGGEPMLYKELSLAIIHAKSVGLTTGIITNGSLLTQQWLYNLIGTLDWVGISIDSPFSETNEKIGRVHKGEFLNYAELLSMIKDLGFKLKVNTVVNRFNEYEIMSNLIEYYKVDRWKVFDTLRVVGQNEQQYDAIKPVDFNGFVINNATENMIVETNDLMTGSYLLIDPLGRFYENWGSDIAKSDSLVTHSVEHCLSQISLDREKFEARGGIYEW
jgi:radical S-adenosyl methionine domain-containing protein 2